MHIEAARAILESVRIRERQGDCPTEPAQSVETLENCLLTVAQQLTEAQADRDNALEQAACIADEHWTESGHVPKPGAVSCAMSISIMIRRLKSPPAARLASCSAQADTELLDWIESVYVGGDELFIDRCELEPDGGGPLFIGFTIHRGKKDDGGNFVSGEETLRAALTAARLASSSEKPNG